MQPGEVRYLLLLLMSGNTYFCRFEEVLGLNPAFRAVFNNVFLANPLENYKYYPSDSLSSVSLWLQMHTQFS